MTGQHPSDRLVALVLSHPGQPSRSLRGVHRDAEYVMAALAAHVRGAGRLTP